VKFETEQSDLLLQTVWLVRDACLGSIEMILQRMVQPEAVSLRKLVKVSQTQLGRIEFLVQ
jgi:hypothetical protein